MVEKILAVEARYWITLVGVFVGALFSLLGVYFANRSNLSRLRVQLHHERSDKRFLEKREKMEELYVLIGHWATMFFSNYMSLRLVMKEEIDYNAYLDRIISESEDRSVDFYRIEMLVNIYGKDLKPSFEKILQIREEINDLAQMFKREYELGRVDGHKFIEPYSLIHEKFYKAVDDFKEEISRYVASA